VPGVSGARVEEDGVTERDLRQAFSGPIGRRSFLGALGLLGGSAALAACTGGTSSSSAPTSASASSAPSASGASVVPSTAPSASSASTAPSPAANVEKELFMYNWSDYVSKDNMALFKEQFGVTNIQYDIYDSNDVLLAKLAAGTSGYDIAAPTAEYVPGMVEQGYLEKLDLARIPNVQYISPQFKGLWWDPTNEYQVPKDWGTTGILYRKSLVSKVPSTWREFYEMTKGEASGKVVFVDSAADVFVFPLKMLGYSSQTTDKAELEDARRILLEVAPHLYTLDSNEYGTKLNDGTAVLALGWTGVMGTQLPEKKASGEAGYLVPDEGSIFWLDTWVMPKDPPHPNAAYAWLNFIQDPEVQAEETNYNLYATPNDAAKQYVKPEVLNDPAVFPSDSLIPKLDKPKDNSGNAQRTDIYEEFKQKVGG
jgi:spermidine/putrescine-binding protein